jgi:hypothetical protein
MISLDALSYAKRLESSGVPVEQAEAHALALADVLVTQAASKADLAALGERLERFVKEQIAILRAEMRAEMQQQKVEILKWVFAAAIGQTSLIIAAIRYMSH